ncbi:MAG: cobalt-precorrin-6A reductase, partial [Mycobacteriales bacterium]
MPLILLLGGTAEARELASRVPVLTSLAGRVSEPRMPPGEVRIGGFGGVEGLLAWLREHQPSAVVDATHPFAARMQRHAVEACRAAAVPLLRLQRPGWVEGPGDRWTRVPSFEAAAAAVGSRRVLLTTGRQELRPFLGLRDVVMRAIEPSEIPSTWVAVLGRPPWSLEDERAMLAEHRIEVVVTKDAGGAAAPKLQAAREAGLEVVVIDRPPVLAADVVTTVPDALTWLHTP